MPGLSLVSLGFFILFALLFVVYWLIRGNAAQKWLLLVVSYGFYAAIDLRFCLILLSVSAVGYELGRRLGRTEAHRARRLEHPSVGSADTLPELPGRERVRARGLL